MKKLIACVLPLQLGLAACGLSTETTPMEDNLLLSMLNLYNAVNIDYTACEKQDGKCIFESKNGHTGNFASISGAANGIDGADLFCNDTSSTGGKPNLLTGTYKALMVDGTNRIGSSGSQVDWVMQAGTNYYRYPDAGLVAAANASAQFEPTTSSSMYHTSRYSDPEFNTSTTSAMAWTGAGSTTWATSANDCSDWATDSSGIGNTGSKSISGTLGAEIFSSNSFCGSTLRVLCVQQ